LETGSVRFDQLVCADITGFIRRHSRRYSHSRAQQVVTALRAFLRYLRLRGLIDIDLTACVPKVAHWSLVKLPAFLHPDQVNRVLKLCDRRSTIGRRDYAMLLLLARLGLRVGEVAALTLDEFNWHDGVFTLRGKDGRWAQMPLPRDVGEALVDYLENGRPSCTDRHFFVRVKAPRRGFRGANQISVIASRALGSIFRVRLGTYFATHWRPRCSARGRLCRRSAFFCVINGLTQHGSTRSSIWWRCET